MKKPSRIQRGFLIVALIPAILLIEFWWLPIAIYQDISNQPVSEKELPVRK